MMSRDAPGTAHVLTTAAPLCVVSQSGMALGPRFISCCRWWLVHSHVLPKHELDAIRLRTWRIPFWPSVSSGTGSLWMSMCSRPMSIFGLHSWMSRASVRSSWLEMGACLVDRMVPNNGGRTRIPQGSIAGDPVSPVEPKRPSGYDGTPWHGLDENRISCVWIRACSALAVWSS